MSKLAALAAKRRQKDAAGAMGLNTSANEVSQDEYTASLSKLTLAGAKSRHRKAEAKNLPEVVSMGNDLTNGPDGKVIDADKLSKSTDDEPVMERIKPSAFADTLLVSKDLFAGHAIESDLVKGDKSTFNFSDPSPDDIVFRAQTGRTR